MADKTLALNETVDLQVTFKDSEAQALVTPDETPTWITSNPSVATIAVEEGGKTATATAVGYGTAVITAMASVALDNGTNGIVSSSFEILVSGVSVESTTSMCQMAISEVPA